MPNRTGFQTFVNNQLPIGVPGDFASVNPHASVNGGQGQFVAAPGGVNVGLFAWFDPSTGLAHNYYTPNSFLGFVHRENNGLITQFLGIATQQVVPGNIVTGQEAGEFLGIFAAGATAKQKVYTDPVTGALSSAATGGSITGGNTGASVSAADVMTTIDADATGTAAAVGMIVYGGGLPAGTYIASSAGTGSGTHLWNLLNVDGTPIPTIAGPVTVSLRGIIETNYLVMENVPANATSDTAALAVTGVLTIAGTITGVWEAGQFVSGAGIPGTANMVINYQIGGTTGGAGTYQTSYQPAVAIANEAMVGGQGQVGGISTWVASAG